MASVADPEEQGFQFERETRRRLKLLPDPAYLWMVFRRHIWFFLGAVVLVLGGVAAYTFSTQPVYVATASVLIEPRRAETIDLQSVVQGLPADTHVVDTLTQIIDSPTVALRVVRRLRLDRDPEFGYGAPTDRADGGPDMPALTRAERNAVAAALGHVSVTRAGLTYVIDITANSHRPEQAAALANAFASEFIALQDARRVDRNEGASAFVTKRANELRAQAVADDKALQNYKIANNLMSAEGATSAEQQVSQLNQQISQQQAALAQERGRLLAARRQLSRGGGGADIGAVLASDTIRSLRAQEATASAELASLQSRFGDLFPDVQRAKRNLADIRAQIQAESQRIVSTLEANVQVAQSGLSSLEGSRAQARGALAANGSAQVDQLDLQRRADASRTIYSAFLQRAKETAATSNLPQADASISSPARLPDGPSSPNYRLAALLGMVAAVALGLLTVAVVEFLDSSVSTREDIEDELGLPYAGAIPDLASLAGRESRHLPPYVYVLSHPFSAFAEAVRAIGAFATRRRSRGSRVVAIASALPREGKTSLSITLARVLAMGRSRVILVDGDLRRHSVSSILHADDDGEERLCRVLDGELPLADALVKDEATDLMILPTRGPTSTVDYMTPERVERLYALLREHCDVAIVDTAPVLGVADTRALTQKADATLVISHWRHTEMKALRSALDVLEQSEANVVGVALSMVNVRQYASTGHGEAYGFHKKFAGYYLN